MVYNYDQPLKYTVLLSIKLAINDIKYTFVNAYMLLNQ